MKSNIPGWVVAVAVVVVIALVGFLGWKQLKPPESLSNAPPPWIDPVTRRPRGMDGGSGAPRAAKPAGDAAAGQPAAGAK